MAARDAADFIVVGAGSAGTAVTRRLIEAGAEVMLLAAGPAAGEAAIRAALAGHLCRCTGYHSILRGARAARDACRRSALREDPVDLG